LYGTDACVRELVAWMTNVFEHRIVDLHDWAKYDYWHPGMKGRTSIKVVLDALWKTDAPMRAYQEMMYGVDSNDTAARQGWASLLKQYCMLDTLSMVLIFEHWRRLTRS
jgi:hypothetical protein